MIGEVERYHGAVLRCIVATAEHEVTFCKADSFGRLNTYLLNRRLPLHIKHSSKRMSPWQFTFTSDQLTELRELRALHGCLWFIFVCGLDGILSIKDEEMDYLLGDEQAASAISVRRTPRGMYHISGSHSALEEAKPQGVMAVINASRHLAVKRTKS